MAQTIITGYDDIWVSTDNFNVQKSPANPTLYNIKQFVLKRVSDGAYFYGIRVTFNSSTNSYMDIDGDPAVKLPPLIEVKDDAGNILTPPNYDSSLSIITSTNNILRAVWPIGFNVDKVRLYGNHNDGFGNLNQVYLSFFSNPTGYNGHFHTTETAIGAYVNSAPTLTLTNPADNQILSEGSSVLLGNTNNFILRITPNDTDASDTLQYTVLLRGVTKQPYTACTKGVDVDYTIPYADLLLGNNAVQVTVKDNNGAEVTINFTLRNKAPSTTSQQSVKEVLTALGYPNTSATCLNDLKPSDYALATLSLGEILNSLD